MMVNVDVPRRHVFGILTMPDETRQFRGNRKNFIDIIRTGQEMGVEVYVITVPDLVLSQPYVAAYRYDAGGKTWSRLQIPKPKVIYNRIPYREDEWLPEVRKTIRACMRHPEIKLFNPFFFNKWTLFEWLRRSRYTRKYIPTTRKFSSKLNLGKTLKKHRFLYLKPEKGKAGKGIMKVQFVPTHQQPYQLVIQEKKKSQTYKFRTLNGLRKKIRHYTGEEEYIVQQGIALAHYQKRPFDLRVLVQKNRRGIWSITGVGARVAGNSSITTHVPRGGSIDDPQKLLAGVFGAEKARRLIDRVKKAALTIARQIERGARSPLGEMSMDLGVDNSGSIWFFEANSKPMKFDEPEIRKKSLRKLIQYGLYLSSRKALPARKRK